jgi:tRNA pseudouridine38-40 synthase
MHDMAGILQMMHRYACIVSYNGAGYEGWQSQTRGTSVQEAIESILQSIVQQKINIIASGRTDAGVSASAQVFMFDTEKEMTGRKWMGALNGSLPADIHIMSCIETDPVLFHARYNVRWKKYVYRINTGPYDVFSKDTAYQCPVALDTEAMRQAIPYLIGTHDFTSLNSSPLSEYPDQVRTIFDIQLEEDHQKIVLTFRGKGFLRYMVRMMSSALIEIGRHKYPPEHMKELLDAKSKNSPHKNAPACGLRLEEANYFEICAMNEHGMIREYLFGDPLPSGLSLTELEKRVQQKSENRIYAFTSRHSQKNLGYFVLQQGQGQLIVFDPQDLAAGKSLLPQMEQWMQKQGMAPICEAAVLISQAEQQKKFDFKE